jgi:hypothetical protein
VAAGAVTHLTCLPLLAGGAVPELILGGGSEEQKGQEMMAIRLTLCPNPL